MRILAFWMLLFAADEWQTTPFPDWSDTTLRKLLTDSPWTRPKTVSFTWVKKNEQPFTYKDVPGADPSKTVPVGSPVGGIGKPKSQMSHLPERADLLIRWSSSGIIREAKALYQLREDRLPAQRLESLIAKSEPGFTLEIFGLPAEVAHKGAASVEAVIQQSTTLRTKTGRVIRPNRTEVKLGALTLNVLIHFSTTDALQPKDQEVEVSIDGQVFSLRERFRLNSMFYRGRLDI